METLKIGTLFSGGLAAVEWAMKYEEFEHEIVFACEWDKYARKQYLAFHGEPSSCFYEDVSDMKGHKYLNTIDLMVWGSPCQDLSLAGKRKGFDGEKSSLFREGARIMSEVMPKAFIFENVKGLLSSNGGADYKEVEKTFRELGYHMAMKVVNAKEQGTAQNRERVFVVGFLDLDDYHNFSFADSVPLTKVLRDYLEDDADEKYYLSDSSIKRIMKSERGIGFGDINTKVSPCLIAQYGKIPTDGFYIKSATSIGYEIATIYDSVNFTHPGSTTRRGRVGVGVAQTLDCSRNQGIIEVKNKRWSIFPFSVRKYIPRECFRLMGMRDCDIILINSDTQSYKIAGNGIEINSMCSLVRQMYRPIKSKNSLF